ncbi:MAG: PEP-CTERM sorting domain-containing protein [Planctomycetes bacterium]|nr:PEP-CTERM sorting domain-containing protein [Planctomycetota bacterium]
MSSRMNKLVSAALTVTCLTFAASLAPAATIGYWQFDDGSAPNDANTLVSQTNSPTVDGTGVSEGSGKPKFNNDVPIPFVRDGIGGSIINAANTTSLKLTNGNLPAVNGHSASVVHVADSTLMRPASFTAEAFVKVDHHIDFAGIMGKERSVDGGDTWQLDIDNTGKLRARFDTQTGSGAGNPPGYNQSVVSSFFIEDGLWHHIALTYDGSTRAFKIYADYNLVGSGTTTFNLIYDAGFFEVGHIAGRAFDGWVDEVRLSDTVLATNQFLTVIPEPSSAALMGLMGLALVRRKR